MLRNRQLIGLKESKITLADIPSETPLSELLERADSGATIYLCGPLEAMTRDYVEQPVKCAGWRFAYKYQHKFRAPVFEREGQRVAVKLVSSWFPGCVSVAEAFPAFQHLREEWRKATGLPLLSTPSKSGQALMWQALPKGVDFPSLPDDLARHIRSVSPQHRKEVFQADHAGDTFEYDGRWMYASLAGLDRLPIGEPIKVKDFAEFQPGWYHVRVYVPNTWQHIGLIPVADENGEGWHYPASPGAQFETWASEPELTLAKQSGWWFEVKEGWRFAKGRPLHLWAKKLIEMRERLSLRNRFSAAAVRQILNHAIGSLHTNTYERESVVDDREWRDLIEAWGFARVATLEKFEDGRRRVAHPVTHGDKLSIYKPEWSGQIWALSRARVAQWALKCEARQIIAINGDAIKAASPLPLEDSGALGQLRLKGGSNG